MHPLDFFVSSTNLVLTFHTVPSQAWFRRTLKTLGRWYRFVSLAEVEAYFYGGHPLRSACHICFDDGERSFYDLAFPVLQDMRVPASLYVSPRVILTGANYWFQELRALRERPGDPAIRQAVAEHCGCSLTRLEAYSVPALLKSLPLEHIQRVLEAVKLRHNVIVDRRFNITRGELLELARSGLVAVGAHTINHPVLASEDDAVAQGEICQSVDELNSLLGQPVLAFAYPNGRPGLDYGPRERALVQQSGVRLAFSTATGFFGQRTDPLAIPRGALSGSERENAAQVVAKLWLIPVWDRIRRDAEARQRHEILEAGVLGGVGSKGVKE